MEQELDRVKRLTESGNTTELLFLAVSRGRLSSISQILRNAPNDQSLLSATDTRGATPLHVACESGHIDVIRSLLAAGAPCTLKWHENTPFQTCTAAGNTTEPFQTALLQAVCAGDVERCTQLIQGGVDANSHQVLCWAADLGRNEVASVLLQHGADVNIARTSDCKTPLHLALSSKNQGKGFDSVSLNPSYWHVLTYSFSLPVQFFIAMYCNLLYHHFLYHQLLCHLLFDRHLFYRHLFYRHPFYIIIG